MPDIKPTTPHKTKPKALFTPLPAHLVDLPLELDDGAIEQVNAWIQDHYHPCPDAQRIKQVRLAHHLTQSQASDLVYRTRRNWQQWESGERRMDPGIWELFHLKLFMLLHHYQNLPRQESHLNEKN